MSLKVQLVRIDNVRQMVSGIDRKLKLLQDIFINAHTKDEIGRTRSAMYVFYGSLSTGELHRIRYAQLNMLRSMRVPVGTLINEGVQLETGHCIPRKNGPSGIALGALQRFRKDGSVAVRDRLAIAAPPGDGKEVAPADQGTNYFEYERESAMSEDARRRGRVGRDEVDRDSISHQGTSAASYGTHASPPSSVGSGATSFD
jgi:Organic solute transport protein 1